MTQCRVLPSGRGSSGRNETCLNDRYGPNVISIGHSGARYKVCDAIRTSVRFCDHYFTVRARRKLFSSSHRQPRKFGARSTTTTQSGHRATLAVPVVHPLSPAPPPSNRRPCASRRARRCARASETAWRAQCVVFQHAERQHTQRLATGTATQSGHARVLGSNVRHTPDTATSAGLVDDETASQRRERAGVRGAAGRRRVSCASDLGNW